MGAESETERRTRGRIKVNLLKTGMKITGTSAGLVVSIGAAAEIAAGNIPRAAALGKWAAAIYGGERVLSFGLKRAERIDAERSKTEIPDNLQY